MGKPQHLLAVNLEHNQLWQVCKLLTVKSEFRKERVFRWMQYTCIMYNVHLRPSHARSELRYLCIQVILSYLRRFCYRTCFCDEVLNTALMYHILPKHLRVINSGSLRISRERTNPGTSFCNAKNNRLGLPAMNKWRFIPLSMLELRRGGVERYLFARSLRITSNRHWYIPSVARKTEQPIEADFQ